MRTLILACLAVAAIGCGGNSSTPDMLKTSGPDMQKLSACGHPGDKGNSKGIGKYCDDANPCPSGLICSDIVNGVMPPNQQTYYCTTTCATSAGGTPDPTECGDNALCLCRTGLGCGCAPIACAAVGMSG